MGRKETGQTIDPDIRRMARFLVERHGDKALAVARKRLAELHAMRDDGAAGVWQQIVEMLQAGGVR
jgi:hypothetical protein